MRRDSRVALILGYFESIPDPEFEVVLIKKENFGRFCNLCIKILSVSDSRNKERFTASMREISISRSKTRSSFQRKMACPWEL
jgi:hypothetical protein